jgi:hypothetical protein
LIKQGLSYLSLAFLALLAAGFGMLAWGFWPPRQTTHLLEIDPEQMAPVMSLAAREARRLSLVLSGCASAFSQSPPDV